ncbi:AMP-binding protein [Streptomyces violaceus]|uniref:AMP-binding protein n=1 Tax=Streptomyces violaceus TaxID=1936 RepID=UPI0037FAD0DB
MTTALKVRLGAGLLHHARVLPGCIALTIGSRGYTYEEAAATARRWAALLVEAAGGRPRRVGVFAHRSEASYLGVAAALCAGAAFVPLNRKFPAERTRSMLERADVDAVIVDSASLPGLAGLLRDLPRNPVVLLPDAVRSQAGDLGDARALGESADEAVAAARAAVECLEFRLRVPGRRGVTV